jgi:transposase-like protein
MKRAKHSPEQIIRLLRDAERLVGEGRTVPEACRELGFSQQSYYRWRTRFGQMNEQEARRLKDLERENRQLKAIVAEKELEIRGLQEIAKEKW